MIKLHALKNTRISRIRFLSALYVFGSVFAVLRAQGIIYGTYYEELVRKGKSEANTFKMVPKSLLSPERSSGSVNSDLADLIHVKRQTEECHCKIIQTYVRRRRPL